MQMQRIYFTMRTMTCTLTLGTELYFYHSSADDTQIFVSLAAGDYGPVGSLCYCIQQISVWMQHNFLQLNSDKTQVIVFGPQKQRDSVSGHLQSLSLKPSNLRVIMNSDLNFNSHIKSITTAAFYHLKTSQKSKVYCLKQMWRYLSMRLSPVG
ncbi:hypothetical protein NL108_007794 [Boleophthalmus pectinirostris]|nr:hypothetical protein NL108_007794 [Boleophthalmus pectinirostris]